MEKCETCLYYEYDYDDGCGYCTVDMDIDDMERIMQQGSKECKMYRAGDDYSIVKKQN